MMPQPVRVMIADDHPIVRDGLTARLTAMPSIDVVAEATSFQQVMAMLPTVQADVLILDLLGMGNSPLTVVERLSRQYPRLAIIVFSRALTSCRKCSAPAPLTTLALRFWKELLGGKVSTSDPDMTHGIGFW